MSAQPASFLGQLDLSAGKPDPNYKPAPSFLDQLDLTAGIKEDQYRPPEDKPWTSDLGEIGRQLAGGVVVGVPQQAGQALKWLSEPGKPLYETGQRWVQSAEQRAPEWEPDLEGRGPIAETLIKGAQQVGPSVAGPLAAAGLMAAAPFEVPAAVGLGLGALAGAVPMGMAQGQESYENVLTAGGTPEEALKAGRINQAIETGGETLGNVALGGMLGAGRRALFRATPVADAVRSVTDTGVLKPLAKSVGGAMVTEPLTEFGQGFGEAAVEQTYGVPNLDPLQQGLEGAQTAIGMTALGVPVGAVGHTVQSRRNAAIGQALSDPATAPEERSKAAEILAGQIAQVDPIAAQQAQANAATAIQQGLPLPLDESVASPNLFTTKMNSQPASPRPVTLTAEPADAGLEIDLNTGRPAHEPQRVDHVPDQSGPAAAGGLGPHAVNPGRVDAGTRPGTDGGGLGLPTPATVPQSTPARGLGLAPLAPPRVDPETGEILNPPGEPSGIPGQLPRTQRTGLALQRPDANQPNPEEIDKRVQGLFGRVDRGIESAVQEWESRGSEGAIEESSVYQRMQAYLTRSLAPYLGDERTPAFIEQLISGADREALAGELTHAMTGQPAGVANAPGPESVSPAPGDQVEQQPTPGLSVPAPAPGQEELARGADAGAEGTAPPAGPTPAVQPELPEAPTEQRVVVPDTRSRRMDEWRQRQASQTSVSPGETPPVPATEAMALTREETINAPQDTQRAADDGDRRPGLELRPIGTPPAEGGQRGQPGGPAQEGGAPTAGSEAIAPEGRHESRPGTQNLPVPSPSVPGADDRVAHQTPPRVPEISSEAASPSEATVRPMVGASRGSAPENRPSTLPVAPRNESALGDAMGSDARGAVRFVEGEKANTFHIVGDADEIQARLRAARVPPGTKVDETTVRLNNLARQKAEAALLPPRGEASDQSTNQAPQGAAGQEKQEAAQASAALDSLTTPPETSNGQRQAEAEAPSLLSDRAANLPQPREFSAPDQLPRDDHRPQPTATDIDVRQTRLAPPQRFQRPGNATVWLGSGRHISEQRKKPGTRVQVLDENATSARVRLLEDVDAKRVAGTELGVSQAMLQRDEDAPGVSTETLDESGGAPGLEPRLVEALRQNKSLVRIGKGSLKNGNFALWTGNTIPRAADKWLVDEMQSGRITPRQYGAASQKWSDPNYADRIGRQLLGDADAQTTIPDTAEVQGVDRGGHRVAAGDVANSGTSMVPRSEGVDRSGQSPGAETASGAAPSQPWMTATPEEEHRWNGSRVEKVARLKGETPWQGTVKRVLGRPGLDTLVEVLPDMNAKDSQATVRLRPENLRVLSVEDQRGQETQDGEDVTPATEPKAEATAAPKTADTDQGQNTPTVAGQPAETETKTKAETGEEDDGNTKYTPTDPTGQAGDADVGTGAVPATGGERRAGALRGAEGGDHAERVQRAVRPGVDGDDQREGELGRDGRHPGGRLGAATDLGVGSRQPSRVSRGNDYRIQPGELIRHGSWLDTARRNVEAVELVATLDREQRAPTKEEQALLTQFVGWGPGEIRNNLFPPHAGIGKNYNPWAARGEQWRGLGERLKEVFTAEDWKTVARSTQYAHYTSEKIIRSIYGALGRMGFVSGSLLEPGSGIGLFAGLMPDAMYRDSTYLGIELDGFSAKIAQLLFPSQTIRHGDYTRQKLPKNFFDVAIGNPPFADVKVMSDPDYRKQKFLLHDYFFAKTIDSVRPGGLLVFVSSNGTMDKKSAVARDYLRERADLLGAIRLPQTAFKDNAGTEVVTDVLFLRKRAPGTAPAGPAWQESVPIQVAGSEQFVNEYFVANPQMVLGVHSAEGSMYVGKSYTVKPIEGDIEDLFAKAALNLPQNVYSVLAPNVPVQTIRAKTIEREFNPKHRKEGGVYLNDDGELMRVEFGVGIPLGEAEKTLSAKDRAFLTDYVPLRDALKQAQYDQLTDGDWETSLKSLNEAYESFIEKHGPVNAFKLSERKEIDEDGNESVVPVRTPIHEKRLRMDVEFTLLHPLERIKDDGTIERGPVLKGRVLKQPTEPKIETISDALAVSLANTGAFDIDHVAQLYGVERADAVRLLGDLVYELPSGEHVMADAYLSGDVKAKLDEAVIAADHHPRFARNVEALQKVQPPQLGASDITVQLGAAWIPEKYVSIFGREVLGIDGAVARYSKATGGWTVSGKAGKYVSRSGSAEWGTNYRSPTELLDAVLNKRQIRVYDTITEGGGKKSVFNEEATVAANDIAKRIADEFGSWVWTDSRRAGDLLTLYNETFNRFSPREFNGDHLNPPGMSLKYKLHPHQKRAVWRQIQTGNTYLAHAVGAGKTLEMIIGGMEQKRLGLIEKPMYVVPNHMLQQFAREFMEAYPAANILVADEQNFHTDNRRRFIAQAAFNAPDAIVITHSAFKILQLKPENKAAAYDVILEDLRDQLEELDGDDQATKRSRREIENRIEKLEQQLEGKTKSEKKDTALYFEDLGVDFLYVDEAHAYRKLDYGTNMKVKGLSPEGSQQALDLYAKTRWLNSQRPGRAYAFASGTPITNSMAEMFTVQRFFQEDLLRKEGLHHFDAWASMFGRVAKFYEKNATGAIEVVERFGKFVNVYDMMSRALEFMDVLTSPQLADLIRVPDVRPGNAGRRELVSVEQSENLAQYLAGELSSRLEESRKWKPTMSEPNNPDPVIAIIGDGRLAAIDFRYVDPSLPNDPGSKLNRMVDEIIRIHQETADLTYTDPETGEAAPIQGATQIVFASNGFGEGVIRNRGFDSRAWVMKRFKDAGIKASEVAWIWDYPIATKKEAMFKEMREGKKRILIGSPKNMGTGVNVQRRLLALHHLDAPWYPSDLEQPEGRIVRQGNQNQEVQIYGYATDGTYDSTMWTMVAQKSGFIEQAFKGDRRLRTMDDVSESSQYALAAAIASGDQRYMQLAELETEVARLETVRKTHDNRQLSLKRDIASTERDIEFKRKALVTAKDVAKELEGQIFYSGYLNGKIGTTVLKQAKTTDVGDALLAAFKETYDQAVLDAQEKAQGSAVKVKAKVDKPLGVINGVRLSAVGEIVAQQNKEGQVEILSLHSELDVEASVGEHDIGRVFGRRDQPSEGEQAASKFASLAREATNRPQRLQTATIEAQQELEGYRARFGAPFGQEQEYLEKLKALEELRRELTAKEEAIDPAALGEQPTDKAEGVPPLESRGQAGITKTHTPASLGQALRTALKPLGDVADPLLAAPWFKIVTRQEVPRGIEVLHERAGEVMGWHAPATGSVGIVADAIPADWSEQELRGLVLHEIGVHMRHLGQNNKVWSNILEEFDQLEKSGDKAVGAAFRRAMRAGVPKRALQEEALAYYIQEHPDLPFARRVLAWFRMLLRKIGHTFQGLNKARWMRWANELRPDDLVAMARGALVGSVRAPNDSKNSKSSVALASRTEDQDAGEMSASHRRVQRRNKEVNADIRLWSEGALPSHTVLDLGHPSAALKAVGFPDLPIHLTQSILAKAITRKHEADVADLMDLTLSVQYPIAVFASKRGDDHRVVLTHLRHRDGNIVVAVALDKKRDEIAVNDITSVHPKQDYKIAHWLADGLLLGYEKTKGRAWLEDSAASNSRQPQAVMAALDKATLYEAPNDVNPTDIRYSRSPIDDPDGVFAEVDKATAAQGPWREEAGKIRDRWESLKGVAKRHWLGALSVRQLAEIGKSVLPGIGEYVEHMQGMAATRTQVFDRADRVAKDWGVLVPGDKTRNRIEQNRLAAVMHEATLAGVDPAEDYVPIIDPKEALKKIGIIRQQMRQRSGESQAIRMQEVKFLQQQMAFERNRKAAFEPLKKRFLLLTAQSQKVYRAARDYHVDQSKRIEAALIEMIEQSVLGGKAKAEAIAKLRKEFEANRVQAPYFPLSRQGDYWVVLEPEDPFDSARGGVGPAEFHLFQTVEQQERFITEQEKAGATINARGKQIENLREVVGVSVGFVEEVENLLKQLGNDPLVDDVRDQVYQLYLTTLPELSVRKHFIHRKKTPGFGQDALRAFAEKAYHDAYQYARLKHGMPLRQTMEDLRADIEAANRGGKLTEAKQELALLTEFRDTVMGKLSAQEVEDRLIQLQGRALEDAAAKAELEKWRKFNQWMEDWARRGRMPAFVARRTNVLERRLATAERIRGKDRGYDFAANVYDELQAAYQQLMNPRTSPLANAANQLGFVWFLGFSPSAWLVNAMQTPMVSLPYAAAKFGFDKASSAFGRAYKRAFKPDADNLFSIRGSLSGQALKAYDEAVEIGLIDRTRAHDLAGLAEEGTQRSGLNRQLMQLSTAGFHHAERLNREVTFIAGFELARESGMDYARAVAYAQELVWKTHLDYAAENRPRLLRGNVARVIGQFKLYSQGITYLLGKSFADALNRPGVSAETRKEARRFLAFEFGLQFAAAGALGLPVGAALMVARAMLNGDDDDPEDFDGLFRQAMMEWTGSQTAGAALSMGVVNALTPIDLHSRLSLSDLWLREPNRELEGRDAAYWVMSSILGPMAGLLESGLVGAKMINDGQMYRGIEKMLPNALNDAAKAARYATEGAQTLKGDKLLQEITPAESLFQALGFTPARLEARYAENQARKNVEQRVQDRRSQLLRQAAETRMARDREAIVDTNAAIRAFNEKNPARRIVGTDIAQSMRMRARQRAQAESGAIYNPRLRRDLVDGYGFALR